MDGLKKFIRRFNRRQGNSTFGGGLPGQGRGHNAPTTLSEKTRRVVISEFDLNSGNTLSGVTTKTIMDDEGPKVVEIATAYRGACGHLIGLNEQNIASAICSVCSQMICSQCSTTRCIKCNSMICKRCATAIDDEVLCINCLPSYRRKKYALSLLKAVHNLLSKEF